MMKMISMNIENYTISYKDLKKFKIDEMEDAIIYYININIILLIRKLCFSIIILSFDSSQNTHIFAILSRYFFKFTASVHNIHTKTQKKSNLLTTTCPRGMD